MNKKNIPYAHLCPVTCKHNKMKTIAFAGSNSSKSINHQLIKYIATLRPNTEVIKLTTYDIPMYNFDIEETKGIPNEVIRLDSKLAEADTFIISVAEHNGNITAFFKNSIDWLSRNNRDFLKNKKVILLSSSPGKGGASSALKITASTLPYFGAIVTNTLSIGDFYKVFKDGVLIDTLLNQKLENCIS